MWSFPESSHTRILSSRWWILRLHANIELPFNYLGMRNFLCATTSKHYPAVVWRSCQLRIEKRIAVSIAKIVEPGCSPGEFAPLYSHSLPHRPLSVLWKCSADYPELFDAPPNCQSGLVARVCSRLQLLLPINLVDPVTGNCWVGDC